MESTERSDWEWIRTGELGLGGDLIFARDVTPGAMIETLGMNPADAQELPASRMEDVLWYPVYDELSGVARPCIRAGRAGEWTFALAVAVSMDLLESKRAARELSVPGSAALLSWNIKLDNFFYFEGGTEVTSFEPLRSYDRPIGTDPDRFVPLMRRVGLRVDPPAPREPFRDPRIAVLEMLTVAFGIRVPRETVEGSLMTIQLGHPAASSDSRSACGLTRVLNTTGCGWDTPAHIASSASGGTRGEA